LREALHPGLTSGRTYGAFRSDYPHRRQLAMRFGIWKIVDLKFPFIEQTLNFEHLTFNHKGLIPKYLKIAELIGSILMVKQKLRAVIDRNQFNLIYLAFNRFAGNLLKQAESEKLFGELF
jgi:hypothetical protein